MNPGTGTGLALVTGFSSQIGKACATRLLDDGFQVIATSRSSETDAGFSKKDFSGGRINYVRADLGAEESVVSLAGRIQETHGYLNTYVHVAGGSQFRGVFEDLSIDHWRAAYEENVLTFVSLVSALLPLLRNAENSSIVAIGSATAFEPGEWNPHYSSSKAALHSFCKHLSNEVASFGIRVNSISLGPIAEIGDLAPTLRDKNSSSIVMGRIPLQRFGAPSDVSGLVSFLAGEQSTWMTGARLQLDGGKARSV